MTRKNIRGVATVTVVAALAAVGAAVATSGGHSGTADAATQNAAVVLPSTSSATPTSGTAGGPAGGPGMGATVTGAAAEKAKAAALAKYPGTVERVEKTPNGSYVVHVIKADHTEVHVLVNAAFQVTGTATGGPGHFGGRPFGGPGMGATVTGAAAEKAKAAALAKYPGTVERVEKTPNGSYVVHVIKADHTEVHVLVNAAFQVTGTATGGPGHFGGRPPWLKGPNARRGSASRSASSLYPTARA